MSLNLGPAVPIFRVDNLDASVAYYIEQIGFQLQWRDHPLASVSRDRTSIMLSEGDQGHPATWLWIPVGDVDALYAELQERGALLRHPPTNYPWGSRECQVTDPDGHVLRFAAESNPDEPLGPWLDGKGRKWMPQPDGSWVLLEFDEAVRGLHHGDFDALAPLFFTDSPDEPARIVKWHMDGRFHSDPVAAAEALTCASFLGATGAAQYFLEAGIDPAAGSGTGMDALHWAVNRGQPGTVDLLLRWGAPLETRNMHGTTVLGTALWSVLNEPRPEHLEIIETLLKAGARRESVKPVVSYVEGHLIALQKERLEQIEAILSRHGAA